MQRPSTSQRIGYLVAEYPAISHTFILREIQALQRLGWDVVPCSIRQTGPEHLVGPDEKAAAKTTFYVLNALRRPRMFLRAQAFMFRDPRRYGRVLRHALTMRSPGLRAALYQTIYFAEATVLAAHIRSEKITHLHNHFANASATVAMLTAELADVPFSFTLHGPSDLTDPARWRLDLKVKAATFVACISHFARSQAMLASAPDDWGKLKIIHCGVVPDRYETEPNKDNTDALKIVFVGRLSAVKGVRVLLKAFAALRAEHPDMRLVLVGDGPDRALLERESSGLGDAVQFMGYRTQAEVADILAQSDMMVLPSFAEGVPVVLMEAMASGKPVIATRVAGVPELVEHDTNGLVVAPGDEDGLRAAIATLMADPQRRKNLGQAGRAKVRAEYNIDWEARRLSALFSGTHPLTPRAAPDSLS